MYTHGSAARYKTECSNKIPEAAYAHAKSKVNPSYFRDSNVKEIDVFIDKSNVIHPLEVKKGASPDHREVRKYSEISKPSLNRCIPPKQQKIHDPTT